MSRAERYEPTDDLRLFDGGEDGMQEEEGSRLALLLALALVVLLAFGGVVYLAYSQGVKQGREEAPRPVVASSSLQHTATAPPSYKDLKVYKPPATDEELANEDAAPPPPTLGAPKPQMQPLTSHGQTVLPFVPTQKAVAPAVSPVQPPKPAAQSHITMMAPAKQIGATGAPRAIAPSLAPPMQTKTAEMAPPPAKPVATTPVASKPEIQAALAPVSTPPATPQAAEAGPAGRFVVQIGAYKSEAEASASWRA